MTRLALPISGRWFERRPIDDSITLLWEPHVIELMRCNIWHVRGRDRDLIVDTGMGVASLVEELGSLLDRPVTAVATHGHDDHIGGHHEFDEVVVHPAERAALLSPPITSMDPRVTWGDRAVDSLERAGYSMTHQYFVSALPAAWAYDGDAFRQHGVREAALRTVEDGDALDLGDRVFEVVHLPGHSPGSIGLWESATGTLFSGDAIYDGPLLDELEGSDIDDYCATMDRLLRLPARVVHGGHDPSFDGDRLHQLAQAYLDSRRPHTS